MIKIFSKSATSFNSNGIRILSDCISCNVKEELNGEYELTLEYPLFGKNKEYINEDNIIVAPTPKGNQAFRIYATETNLNIIYVNARHIFYDLMDNFLEDVRPTNQNGAGALSWILSNTQFNNNFTSSSDITKTSSASYVRKNVVEALLSDDDNSFINRWGGQLLRDNWNITINKSVGEDRGVKILYGKNLLGLQASVDISSVVTRVMPTGLKEDDTVLTLPEKYIDSDNIDYYSRPKIAHYHYSDIKVGEDDLTEAQALEQLRTQASLLFSEMKIDEPSINIKVDFIELSKTEEYKNYSILETIFPFDTVTVEYQGIGFSQKAKMISYEYDCLLDKYVSIELGQFVSNYADAQAKVNQELIQLSKDIEDNKDYLQAAIDNATGLLTNALGGYVLKREGELLIMDTEDPNTATKVWRWNLNGLGYSSTGINGPYTTAITMDGGIVATFITTGTLNANLVKTGILQDKLAKNYINMDNGTFGLGDGKIVYDGTSLNIYLDDGTGIETKLNVMSGEISSKISDGEFETYKTQTATQIESKVNSSDFASMIQQNSDSVKIAVGQVGGTNLVKNGNAAFGLEHWKKVTSNGTFNTYTSSVKQAKVFQIISENTENAFVQQIEIPVMAGGKYSLSFDYVYNANLDTGRLIIRGGTDYGTDILNDALPRWLSWRKYSKTFTVPEGVNMIYLRFVNTGKRADATGNAGFSFVNVALVEGGLASNWMPHESELKGINYTFDTEGFKIGNASDGTVSEHTPEYSKWTHSDGSYSKAGTDGFKRFVAGSGNKYHSLFYIKWLTFNVTSASDEKLFTLPEEFQGIDPYLFVVVENITVPYGHTLSQFGASAGINNAATREVFVNAWVNGYEGSTLTYEGSICVYVVAMA